MRESILHQINHLLHTKQCKIHGLYLQDIYWVLSISSIVWTRNKSDIATAVFIPYFRYKYMDEHGYSIQCRRFIWARGNQVNKIFIFFLSKPLKLFIKRTFLNFMFYWCMKEIAQHPDPFFFLKIFKIKKNPQKPIALYYLLI